ncbi:MAG TPA: hypothetical protein VNA13_01725 [Xanthomonadales bacterium]|nr:hypothetical protein [Xanthomonadales bacterium]
MSLHKATELIKKFGIGMGIGLGVIIIISIFVRIGGYIISVAVPPKITPPNQAYDALPAIEFPRNKVDNNFTYVLNTVSGALPADFPDRLIIYPLEEPEPNFLNLDKAKEKAGILGFTNREGKVIPETALGNGNYEWADASGINRKLRIDTVTFNFALTSNYLAALTVLGSQDLSDEQNAIETARDFLERIELLPKDVDIQKISNPQKDLAYDTYPKLFSIRNGTLIPTTSLSTARVIRVDFHQKDIEYDLDTGIKKAAKLKMKLPIRYPDPPFSTMSFWIASGENTAEIYAANFIHNNILIPTDTVATYPIKTSGEAFEDLKNGKAYIASYNGLDQQILISNIYLAYYLGETKQSHLMPIVVFEGQDGFFAYVPAVKTATSN